MDRLFHNYKELIMLIKEGMIGFSGGNEFIQKAIRFFIGSEFSHSFVTYHGPYNCLSVLETTEAQICFTPFHRKDYEKNWIEIWEVIASDELKRKALEKSYIKYAGKWYGYLSYIWFIYRWICRLFKIEKTKMWGWVNDGITCTELTSNYLYQIFPELFIYDLNTYSPKELRNLMMKNTNKFILLGWYKGK